MSLKHFHVVFILLAVACSLGFALWSFLGAGSHLEEGVRIAGVLSGICGAGLACYGVWFLTKKSKSIII
jgi:high-affinity Fe2+/Pb2+ permease